MMNKEEISILVVDDNEMNRDMLSRRLEKRGFVVGLAEDGFEALEQVKQNHFDIILLDMMMPGLSGSDTLKLLRQDHPIHELPVIIVSAKNQSQDQVDALGIGANDYVTKPIDFPLLLARIQAQLRIRDSQNPRGSKPKLEWIAPGNTVEGKYKIDSLVGEGSWGKVYQATHLDLDRMVAIKTISAPAEPSLDKARERLRQEGIASCRITHPNAVTVLDFGITNAGEAYLVMEFLEGKTIAEELESRHQIPLKETLGVLLPVCRVLALAHSSGLIHRDIKPANIFLESVEGGRKVKVLDFGIAKWMASHQDLNSMTREGVVVGTPTYISPERLQNKPYDGKSDIYSLGIVFFEMLAGRPPFVSLDGEPLHLALMHVNEPPPSVCEWNSDIEPQVDSFLFRMLEKDPNLRPSAEEVIETFRKWI